MLPFLITRTASANILAELEVNEWASHLSNDTDFNSDFGPVGGPYTEPGSMIRVMVGDMIETNFENKKGNQETHNSDFQSGYWIGRRGNKFPYRARGETSCGIRPVRSVSIPMCVPAKLTGRDLPLA